MFGVHEVMRMKSMDKAINNYTFTDYFLRLNLLAQSVFKWEGLPNNISEEWIERYLFNGGFCVFFKDETLGEMVAEATTSEPNHYNEPTTITVVSKEPDLSGKVLKNFKDCVVIKNNNLMLPTLPTIQLYAYRLAEITRTSDINITAQKTPYMITGGNRKLLSLKNLFRQIKDNEPIVFMDDDLGTDPVKVHKTDAPIVFPDLRTEKNHVWNECMTFLGINNANTDKRERLVDDEVQANNEQIQLSAHVMLKSRQEACERINAMFGTKMSVSIRKFNTGEIQAILDGTEGGNND